MTGYCTACGVEIMDLSEKGKARLLESYASHIVELSDGTLMQVGVCADCKLKLVSGENVKKTADKILDNHKTYWSGQDDKKRPIDYDKMTVTDPNTSPEKHFKKKAIKEHEEKITRLTNLKNK